MLHSLPQPIYAITPESVAAFARWSSFNSTEEACQSRFRIPKSSHNAKRAET